MKRVDVEPGDGAERGRRAPHEALGVGQRRDGDVAALAVGQHEQAGLARVRAGGLEGEPAGGAEPLEAGELRLGRDAGGTGGVDQRAAVHEHGGGRLGGGGCRARGVRGVGGADERDGETLALLATASARGLVTAALGLARVRPQAGGIRIDPEDDLRLASRDRGGEPIAESGRR